MRYLDKQGNILSIDECMKAESFFVEAVPYTGEHLEMHFDENGELKAGKKKVTAVKKA